MKKIFALILIFVMSIQLCACGNKKESENTDVESVETTIETVEYFSEYKMPKPEGLTKLNHDILNRTYYYALTSDLDESSGLLVGYVRNLEEFGLDAEFYEELLAFKISKNGNSICMIGLIVEDIDDYGVYRLAVMFE